MMYLFHLHLFVY